MGNLLRYQASKMKLLTNNPRKIIGLEGFGLEVVSRLPIEIESNEFETQIGIEIGMT